MGYRLRAGGGQVLGWEARRDKGEGRGIRSRLKMGEDPGEGAEEGRLKTGRGQGLAEGSVGVRQVEWTRLRAGGAGRG